jgi:ABC-type glutathione transport system ATPase component
VGSQASRGAVSTTANAILQVLRPPPHRGRADPVQADSSALRQTELRRIRWRNVALVMQSAMSCSIPSPIGDQFVDMFLAHQKIRSASRS